MSIDIYTDLFNKNKDFRNYVEKYIFKHHITIDEALRHRLVRDYGDYLIERGDEHENKNYLSENKVVCGC